MKETILAFIPFLVEFSFFFTQIFTLFLLVLSIQLIYANYFNESVWWQKICAMTTPSFKIPCSLLELSFYIIAGALFFLGLWSLFKIEITLMISVILQFSSFFAFCMGLATILFKRKTV